MFRESIQRAMMDRWPTLEVCGLPPEEQSEAPIAVLLTGFPDDHATMAKLADDLKFTHRVVIGSFPLFDKQSLDKGQKPIESHEEVFFMLEGTIFDVLRRKENTNKKVTLIVHDWACYFGHHFAFLHSDVIDALIVLDIGASVKVQKKEQSMMLKEVSPMSSGENEDRTKFYDIKVFKNLSGNAHNRRKIIFYQLMFCLCTFTGKNVSSFIADLMLHNFLRFTYLIDYFVPKTVKAGARPLKEVHWWMCYPYNALWYKLRFMNKKEMKKYTYSSSYTTTVEESNARAKADTSFSGQLPIYNPLPPNVRYLFLYGSKKNLTFHSEEYCKELRSRPGCASMPIEGGHYFFLDQPKKVAKIIRDFMQGIVYKYAEPVDPKL